MEQYHQGLLQTARSIIGREDAEEVVQEAWISAYKSIERFEGRSSVRTWLYRIVVNEAKMRLRSARRALTVNIDPSDVEAPDERFQKNGRWRTPPVLWTFETPEEMLQEKNLLDCVEKTMAALPDAQRLLLEFRDIQGLEFDEICNVLDVSASNARVLLHRARTAMYRMVDIYQETGEC